MGRSAGRSTSTSSTSLRCLATKLRAEIEALRQAELLRVLAHFIELDDDALDFTRPITLVDALTVPALPSVACAANYLRRGIVGSGNLHTLSFDILLARGKADIVHHRRDGMLGARR
jgi:hypothetical protein